MNSHIAGQLRLISFLACIALYVVVIHGAGDAITARTPAAVSPPIALAMK